MQSSKVWGLRRITDVERYRGLKDGETGHWWEGFVCYDPPTTSMLVAPIPLNFVLSWLRDFWVRLKRGRRSQELLWSYNLGYGDGRANRERADLRAEVINLIARMKRD